jgi:hypothetical protein
LKENPVTLTQSDVTEALDAGSGLSVDTFAPSLAGDRRIRGLVGRFESMAGTPRAMKRLIAMNRQIDIRHVLPAISVRTLVIHCRGERIAPVEHGRYYAQRIPGARCVEFPARITGGGRGTTAMPSPRKSKSSSPDSGTTRRSAVSSRPSCSPTSFGSTERAAEVGDRRWRDLLDAHDAAIRRASSASAARRSEPPVTGSAAFDGPARAIHCAHAIAQDARGLGIEV